MKELVRFILRLFVLLGAIYLLCLLAGLLTKITSTVVAMILFFVVFIVAIKFFEKNS